MCEANNKPLNIGGGEAGKRMVGIYTPAELRSAAADVVKECHEQPLVIVIDGTQKRDYRSRVDGQICCGVCVDLRVYHLGWNNGKVLDIQLQSTACSEVVCRSQVVREIRRPSSMKGSKEISFQVRDMVLVCETEDAG